MCLLHGPCHLLGCGLPSRLRGSVLSVSSLCGRWSQERLLREWASGTGEGRKLLVSVPKRATSVGSRGPVAPGTSGDRVEHAPELPPCWAGALGDFRDCQSVRCSRRGTGSVRGTGIPCHLHLAQTSLPVSPRQLLALFPPVSCSPQADPHPCASGLDGVIPPGSG